MEKLDERRRALLGEVDKALAILRELPDLRSKGTKDLLFHNKFLEANASLAQHTRAYVSPRTNVPLDPSHRSAATVAPDSARRSRYIC